jgi:hypothetical protein
MCNRSILSRSAVALRLHQRRNSASITCPAFVTDNETDVVSAGQGRLLFDHLTCPKEFRLFTEAEGAEGRCNSDGWERSAPSGGRSGAAGGNASSRPSRSISRPG